MKRDAILFWRHGFYLTVFPAVNQNNKKEEW